METKHPRAKELIKENGIPVQRSGFPASRQAMDQAGEQIYNLSARIPGGIKNFAGNQNIHDKRVLNRPQQAQYREGLLDMTGLQRSSENLQKH